MAVSSCSYSPTFTKPASSSSPKSRASRVARAVATNFPSFRRRRHVSGAFSNARHPVLPQIFVESRRIARPFRRIIRHGDAPVQIPLARDLMIAITDTAGCSISEAHHSRERFSFRSASSLERCSTALLIEKYISRESYASKGKL